MLIVTDDNAASGLPEMIGDCPVTCQGLGTELSSAPRIMVVDIDLYDIHKVERLRHLLKQRPEVLAVSVESSNHHARTQAYALGASTLLPHPLNIGDLKSLLDRENAALRTDPECRESVMQAANALNECFTALEAQTNLDMTQVKRSSEEIVGAIVAQGMARWLDAVRSNHESTFQHCLLVTGVATAFGHANGMRRRDVTLLTTTGLLHDIGKVRVPIEILDKPDALTPDEYAIVRRHPVTGYDYLTGQDADVPGEVLSAVRHHHEYLDGSGYPDGLSGSQIDDLTRILTVCDIYGALVESRAYKRPAAPEMAIANLIDLADAGKVERALVMALAKAVRVTVH